MSNNRAANSSILTAPRFLELVVFLCGGVIMVLELTGSRLMAPYLGTSIFVWTSLIGVILGSLSLGYWLGGKWADQRPDVHLLSRIIFWAGISVTGIALLGDPLLIFTQGLVKDVRTGSLLTAMTLFGLPGILLGMVTPFAARLKLSDLKKTGATTGNLYALSTLGSISGTFLSGFFLLSYFSHRIVLFILSFILICLAALISRRQFVASLVSGTIIIVFSSTNPFIYRVMGEGFVEEQTAYNRVWIYDGYRGDEKVRAMQINDTGESLAYVDRPELALDYTKYFRLAGHFHSSIQHALLIGGGAFSYPISFLEEFTNATIDVVEIDPELIELSRKYFHLHDDPRLRIFTADGRIFLNQTTNQYQVVFGDAFKSYTVPYQLTTIEAMKKVYSCLSDDGVYIMNVIASVEGEKGKFFRALLSTLDKVFPQVLIFAVQDIEDSEKLQNLMIVALKNPAAPLLTDIRPDMAEYLSHRWGKVVNRDLPPLTDDFAPVERYASAVIVANPAERTSFLQKKLQVYLNN